MSETVSILETPEKTARSSPEHRRRGTRVMPALTALVLGLVGSSACSSCTSAADSPEADQADAGSRDATGERDATVKPEAGRHDAQDAQAEGDADDGSPDGAKDADPDVDPAVAKYVPQGWRRWWGWSKQCPQWYPGDTGTMPKLHWEPCSKDADLPSGFEV